MFRTMQSVYILASFSKVVVVSISRKWVDLVSLSIITHMQLFSWLEFGNLTSKSMLMYFHFQTGISSGFIGRPAFGPLL